MCSTTCTLIVSLLCLHPMIKRCLQSSERWLDDRALFCTCNCTCDIRLLKLNNFRCHDFTLIVNLQYQHSQEIQLLDVKEGNHVIFICMLNLILEFGNKSCVCQVRFWNLSNNKENTHNAHIPSCLEILMKIMMKIINNLSLPCPKQSHVTTLVSFREFFFYLFIISHFVAQI